MKAIDFYKFIHDNSIEFHWCENDETNERDVVFFVAYYHVDEFRKLLSYSDFDDGIYCVMKGNCFAFWASAILSRYNIELTEIFGINEQINN